MVTALPTGGIATRQVYPAAKQRNEIPFEGACLPIQLWCLKANALLLDIPVMSAGNSIGLDSQYLRYLLANLL